LENENERLEIRTIYVFVLSGRPALGEEVVDRSFMKIAS
jgi:hypothetical protein